MNRRFLWVRNLGLWWLVEFGAPAKIHASKRVLEKSGTEVKATMTLFGEG